MLLQPLSPRKPPSDYAVMLTLILAGAALLVGAFGENSLLVQVIRTAGCLIAFAVVILAIIFLLAPRE